MTTKETLKENYQQYLCELGSGHEETKAAKKLYDNYCIAEQETIEKACKWFRKEYSYAVEEWLDQKCEELKKAMEDIVSRYIEPIDENELDKLAQQYFDSDIFDNKVCMLPEIYLSQQDTVKEIFKAGYRKAMEEEI